MPQSGDRGDRQWSLLELLKRMQLDETPPGGAPAGEVPGADSLHRRMLLLRPKLELYPNSLVVKDIMPRLARAVEQAHEAWQHGKLDASRSEPLRVVSLLAAAEHLTRATHLCGVLEAHVSPSAPAAGELGRTKHYMFMARDTLVKGWCQGAEARDARTGEVVRVSNPRAGQWSLTGALRLEFGRHKELRALSHQYLSRVLGVPPERLEEWNDAEERTYGEVLLALDRAIHEIDRDTRGRPPP